MTDNLSIGAPLVPLSPTYSSTSSQSSISSQPLPKVPSPQTRPDPSSIQAETPEGSVLHGLAELGSLLFVGKSTDELGRHFSLYRPQQGALKTACEMLKATGRAAALVLGSVLVGASRAVALGGSAFIGGLLTMAVMASVVGLVWVIFDKNATDTLFNAGKLAGTAAAAIPAFVGACCQQLAFQNPKSQNPITTKELWNTTWRQNEAGFARLGSGVGVCVGFVLAFFGQAFLGVKS